MRRLTAPEVAGYDLVPAEIARRARVQQVPVLAPGTAGMTLGRLILLRRDDDRTGRRTLLAHELVHVEQYDRLGVTRFLWRYLRAYGSNLRRLRSHRRAYEAIPFEAEARAAAARWASRRPEPAGNRSPVIAELAAECPYAGQNAANSVEVRGASPNWQQNAPMRGETLPIR